MNRNDGLPKSGRHTTDKAEPPEAPCPDAVYNLDMLCQEGLGNYRGWIPPKPGAA